MDERHVPPVSLRYWILFLIASVFGSHMGDVVMAASAGNLVPQILIFAGVLFLIFLAEHYDRWSSDAYYWCGVIVVQMMANRLADFAVLQLGINRLALVIGLAVLLVTTVIMSRSEETRLFSRLVLERSPAAAKPMADLPHWLGLFVASILGAAVADVVAINFHFGSSYAALTIAAVVIVLLYLQRRTRPVRLHAFWLTTTLVRADGISIGDVLVKSASVQMGLALSALLSGVVIVVLLIWWRPPKSLV